MGATVCLMGNCSNKKMSDVLSGSLYKKISVVKNNV